MASLPPSGLGGRTQHGHSSGAHSTSRDQCWDAKEVDWVVVWWVDEMGQGDPIIMCACENQQSQWKVKVVGTELVHQPVGRWSMVTGQCVCWGVQMCRQMSDLA